MATPPTLESLGAAVGALQKRSYGHGDKLGLGIFLTLALLGAAAGVFALLILLGYFYPPFSLSVKIAGNLTAQSINASNIVSTATKTTDLVVKSLTTTGDISAGGKITATGDISAGASLSATGDISAGAAVKISAGGTIVASGDITANGNLNAPTGNLYLGGGNIGTSGDKGLIINSKASDIQFNGNLIASGLYLPGEGNSIYTDGNSLYINTGDTYHFPGTQMLVGNIDAGTGTLQAGGKLAAPSIYGSGGANGTDVSMFNGIVQIRGKTL